MEQQYIASFDIGKKNFAFVIEQIPNAKFFKELKQIPKTERYHKNGSKSKIGTCTDEFQEVLTSIYDNNKVVMISNNDLTIGTKTTNILEDQIYINMLNVLEKYKSYWDRCKVILIEKQMAFGPQKQNIMAIKLAQHCYTYFMITYKGETNAPQVFEFPAYLKTQLLGAPKSFGTITKHFKNGKTTEVKDNRKRWAARTAIEILTKRDDTKTLEMIESKHSRKQQQDDMSDCLLMCEAFCVWKYL